MLAARFAGGGGFAQWREISRLGVASLLQAGVFYQKGAFNGGFAIVDEPPAEEAAVEGGEKPQ